MMTNRERIQRAFDALQPSRIIEVEEKPMKKHVIKHTLALACAMVLLVLCGLAAAYATDVGGFRETITIWFGGKQQTVEVTQPQEGMIQWTDEEGNEHTFGGVVYNEDGTERVPTVEELLQSEFNGGPVMDFFPDGTAFLEFYENYVEVTDQIPSGRVEAKLEHEGVTYYITFVGSRETGWKPDVSTEGFAP